MSEFTYTNSEFDSYAADYDAALERGLSVSGEDKNYFARGRVEWLAGRLHELGERPARIMDFGCGTGSAAPFLFDVVKVEQLLGVDTSEMSLHIARKQHGSDRTRFVLFDEYQPDGQIDLAFCNGVFHHIPPTERAAAVSYIYQALRPGGLFAFWENNPWNPGTRYVMSRIRFDRDAIPVTPPQAHRMLTSGGFEVVRRDFLFIFPRALRWFRSVEPRVARLPMGAQYQLICRKPNQVGPTP